MRIVFDKVDSLKQMSTDQVRLLVEGGMTLRKEGSQSTYSVKWAKDKNAFEVVKENKSNWGAIKSWFSHGLFGGHTSTRATRIAETLNNRANELRTAGFATLDSRNKEHHWTSERVGKEIDARLPAQNNREIFMYGFAKTRGDLNHSITPLAGTLSNAQSTTRTTTIDDYNKDLGINWGLGFEDYLDILDEAKSNTLVERSKNAPQNSPREHSKWAEFLQANHQKLDITRHKDGTLDTGPEFFAKNFSPGGNDYNDLTDDLRDAMQEDNPQLRREKIELASNNIRKVLNMATDPNFTTEQKKEAYNKLEDSERFCLDKLVTKSFFRKTSKLGLEFARSQGAMVAFSWKPAYYYENLQKDLGEKPWKNLGSRGKFYEAITFSEMRKLVRLESQGAAPPTLRFVNQKKIF
jgi:hypothetical protein